MSDVDYGAVYDQDQTESANANLQGAHGVAPAAALGAIDAAPQTGVDPSLGMKSPDNVVPLAQLRGSQEALDASPALRTFAARSPAHVAATRDDWPALRELGAAADSFLNGGYRDALSVLHRNYTEATSDIRAPTSPGEFIQRTVAGQQRFFSNVGAAVNIVQTATDPFHGLPSRLGTQALVSAVGPEHARKILDMVNTAMLGLGPTRGAGMALAVEGAAAEAGRIPTPPPPHPIVGGWRVGAEGEVVHPGGAPVIFGAPQEAAPWVVQAAKITPPGVRLEITPGAEAGTVGVREVRTVSPSPGVRPEADAVHVAQADAAAQEVQGLEEAVAATQTAKRSPALTEQFLSGTALGGQTAWVNPQALAGLYAEGLTPFPAHAAAISDALTSGRDVAIPMPAYLAEVSGKPYADALRAATRFTEEGVSQEEAKGLSSITNQLQPDPNKPGFFLNPLPNDSIAWADLHSATPQAANTALQDTINAAHRNAIEVELPISKLVGIEESLGTRGLETPSVELPVVEHIGGRYYITDGNHRVVAAMLRGASTVRVRLADVDAGLGKKPAQTEPTLPEDITPADLPRSLNADARFAVDEVFAEQLLDSLIFEPKALGLTKPQMERYSNAIEEARAEALDRLFQRTYTQIRRERTPEWKDRVGREVARVEGEVQAQPAVQAAMELQYGEGPSGEPLERPGLKLDRRATVEGFGASTPEALPKAMFGSGGLHPDDLAPVWGYANGHELLSGLLDLEVERLKGGHTSTKATIKARVQELATARAREALGYDISPEGLKAAAEESAHLPAIENLLIEQLRALGEQVGLPLTKDAIEEMAKRDFDTLRTGDATKTMTFVRGMRRAGKDVEDALQKGDAIRAFKAKQRQYINWKEIGYSHFLQKKVAAATKRMRMLARRKAIRGMSQDFLDQLHAFLPQLGFPTRRNPGELAEALGGVSLSDFVDGIILRNADFPDVPTIVGPLGDLKVEDFWANRAFVYAMHRYGREEQSLITQAGVADRQATIERLLANAPAPRQRRAATLSSRRNLLQSTADTLRNFIAIHQKVVDLGEYLDKGQPGVMWETVEVPIHEAANTAGRLHRETYQPVVEAFQAIPKATRRGYGTVIGEHPFVAPDGTKLEVRRADVPAIALYVGEQSGLEKLAGGYGAEPQAVLDWLAQHITAPEADFVQMVWDQFEKVGDEVSPELRALTGTGLQREPARAWVLPFGTYRGGHWKVEYNRTLDQSAALREARRAAKVGPDPSNQLFASVMPDKGFAESRTGYVGPVLIDLGRVASVFDSHIKYAAYARTVNSIRRFVNDPTVRDLITTRQGPEAYDQFNPWLDAMVQDASINDKALRGLERLVNQARYNVSIATLGLSYTTMIAQAGGWFNSMGVLGDTFPEGLARMAGGTVEFARMVLGGRVGEIFAQDEHMRERFGQVEANLTQALEHNRASLMDPTLGDAARTYQAFQNIAMQAIGWMEFATVSGPTWVAGKAKGLNMGMDEAAAVQYASRMVRKSQGSGRQADLAAIARGSGFQRWFYQYNTFFNTQFQRLVETGREANWGNYPKAFNLFLTIFILAPLVQAMLTNKGPADLDPDTVLEWGGLNAAFNLFGGVMFAGSAASTLNRNIKVEKGKVGLKARNIRDVDWSADPSTRMIAALAEFGFMVGGGKTKRPVTTAATALGLGMGLPGAVQIGRSGEYLYEVLGSGDQQPKDTGDVLQGLTTGPSYDQRPQGRGARRRTVR